MGLRFRRSVKIIPGVRLNFSKSGTSLSLGGRGFTTNISKRGTKTTVGLPGTGISYSTFSPREKARISDQHIAYGSPAPANSALVAVLKVVFVFLLLVLIAETSAALSRFF